MASSVYYKFKSQRDESKVSFDGTGISVFDLKKEIVLANNLKANDFDLLLFDPSTNQEYGDDSYVIPRSSSVIAKRIPAAKPGKGKGALYIAATSGTASSAFDSAGGKEKQNAVNMRGRIGLGAMSKRFDGKEEPAKPKVEVSAVPSSVTNDDEASAMAAMFKAQTENWEETQERMSTAMPIYNNSRGAGRGGKPFVSRPPPQHQHQPEKPLPASYVCYRCGQKGHWIYDCPTNNDRDFDHRPRIKRTTGIPRSFLKAVDQPSEGKLAQGIMVTPDGGFVVAQPDLASWQKQVSRSKGMSASDVRELPPTDPTLACPIDKKLILDAVKAPCCGKSYCEECINTHLLENDFICPQCGKKVASLDKLVLDKPMRTRVGDYIDKMMKESQEAVDAAESSTAEGAEASKAGAGASADAEFTFDQQPGTGFDVSQMLSETIPQLQAQIAQISVMLQNPSLPLQVRQSTEFQYQQLQMQLQQAQTLASFTAEMSAAASAVAAAQLNGDGFNQGFQQPGYNAQWNSAFPIQQPAGQDSAYQRLPVNNRRRVNKRERPSDFLEIGGGEMQAKMPKFWE